jgi:hypothetical protein
MIASCRPNIRVNIVAPSRCRLRPGLTPAFMLQIRDSKTTVPSHTFDCPESASRFHGAVRMHQSQTSSSGNAAPSAQLCGNRASGKFTAIRP